MPRVKVVGIVGSPHLGSTYRVVRKVEEDLKALGDVDFEYVLLKDASLGQCRGCTVCITVSEDRCPPKDDRTAIEAKMAEADGVILATPVYSLQVSALMKSFMDRLSYCWHRPRYFKHVDTTDTHPGLAARDTDNDSDVLPVHV